MKLILLLATIVQRGWNKADQMDGTESDGWSSGYIIFLVIIAVIYLLGKKQMEDKKNNRK